MSFLFSHSNSKHSPLLYVLWFRTFPADLDPGSQHTDLGAAVWTFLLRSPRCTWRPGSHLGVPWEPTGGHLSLAAPQYSPIWVGKPGGVAAGCRPEDGRRSASVTSVCREARARHGVRCTSCAAVLGSPTALFSTRNHGNPNYLAEVCISPVCRNRTSKPTAGHAPLTGGCEVPEAMQNGRSPLPLQHDPREGRAGGGEKEEEE